FLSWQVRLSVIDVTNMHSQHGHKKTVVSPRKKIAGKVIKCDEQAYFLTVARHFALLKGKKKECMLGNSIRKNNTVITFN
ncbi:hypothetical protein ACQP3D_27355, partial [Escherichia coli]